MSKKDEPKASEAKAEVIEAKDANVKATAAFFDLEAKLYRAENEEWTCSKERADLLKNAGLVTISK